jgi:26S proteasome regulatory subunit N2
MLIATCIDEYKTLRLNNADRESGKEEIQIDPRMENIMEQMFQRCYKDNCFEQAIGIALDTRRIDKLEEVCKESITAGNEGVLGYTYDLCQGARNIPNRDFRLEVIDVLVRMYGTLEDPDFKNVCFALQSLNRPYEVAQTLYRLMKGSEASSLQAYQIAFDLQEAENQGFVLKVVSALKKMNAPISAATGNGTTVTEPSSDAVAGGLSVELPMDMDDEPSPSGSPVFLRRQTSTVVSEDVLTERLDKMFKILTEGFDVDLCLNFLFKQNKADISVLNDIKTATESSRALPNVLHNALVVAHSFMNCGTTEDLFLRNNLEWLGKATNWAKYTAVASVGVVHKGHVHESMNLLQPYLPRAGQSSSPYSESGALYALGLIHANKGGSGDSTTINYLRDALRNSGNNEIVQHGCTLGIGLAAMATGDEALFAELQNTLYTDSAVAGEGAALAIGLLLVGQSDSQLAQDNINELMTYAHGTTHEKIVRAVALSIAMMVYGKEEGAEVIIEQMIRDRDPIIRYGGMYAISMAYCGTADNNAVRRLLHVAVSDVSDDVRRAAVTCIGLVMFRQPDAVPKLVSLLAESFNPHVRYGACMAIGIACAGTADKDAIELLQTLIEDPTDYVRNGALLGMALTLQQCAEARSPSVKKFRAHLTKIINDKHQVIITKSGAILAAGLLDAGGRNCVLSLQSRGGFMKMGAAVGVMMFLQSWYWYPLYHMISLSLCPTMLIGLNKDFNMPVDFGVICTAPPSMFAYPKPEEKKEDDKKPVAHAVLSTTARAKAREAKKDVRAKLEKGTGSGSGGMEAPSLERTSSYLSTDSGMVVEETPVKEEKKKEEKEPSSFTVTNPSRLVPSQRRFIKLMDSNTQRYQPADKRSVPAGIVMLLDNDPTAEENVTKVERVLLGQEEEAEAPEPFEWNPANDIN